MAELHIGFDRSTLGGQAPIALKPHTLLRHMMTLGSSGSGKTVLCKAVVEDCVLQGIPVICVDPQGDLCSLALAAADPDGLAARGLDPVTARRFAEVADVVVLTPSSRKGVALSADPIHIDLAALAPEDRVHAVSSIAAMIVSLLGYKLDSDDGEGLIAVFDKSLGELLDLGRFPRSLQDFADFLANLDGDARGRYARYLDSEKLDNACKRLARLDVGARRLLFHEGLPLDIDLLLGRGPRAAVLPGKTRVSVIYLNSLQSQEDKDYFVAALTEQLYAWMLQNPSEAPQALFYIDEVAPFIPPVRKPACKDSLAILFKQARKYGVCCLMSTQNPGDVDYKAMAQFGTWALGRLTTVQDQKKVQPTVKSLDPVSTDLTMNELPALKPGEFLLFSPDNFDHTRRLRARWLYTEHQTLDEERIERLTDERWRARFDALERQVKRGEPAAQQAQEPPAAEQAERAAEGAAVPVETALDESVPEESAPDSDEPPASGSELQRRDAALATQPMMSIAEFAGYLGISQRSAGQRLRQLTDQGLAGRFRQGTRLVYWSRQTGLRPDLGLTRKLRAAVVAVREEQARAIAQTLCRTRMAGLIGVDESVDALHLEHRLVLRVSFHEMVERAFWQRILGPSHEERAGAVYLHPSTLDVLIYSPDGGIRWLAQPQEYLTRIVDLDAVAFEDRLPGELELDDNEWRQRLPDEQVKGRFKQRYGAIPRGVETLVVPMWRVHLRGDGRDHMRLVRIDALAGREVAWP